MIKLILILPILFEAISEGLYLSGHKVMSKQIQVLLIASWFVCMAFIPFTWQIVVIYILLRFVVFNYVHNLSAGLPLNYLGKVSFIDRILVLLCMGQFWFILLAQGICLALVWFILTGKI